MKKPALAAGMVLALALVAACARRHDAVAVRIAIGGQNQLLYLPTTLAAELGYYRDEGLTVDLQDFPGGSKALQALIGGSADVVSGFYDHTIQMAAEGREMTAFVTMLRYPGLVLVTSPQSAVRRVEDLKGRIVGVTTVGSSSHMLLTYLLKRHGVAADSLSVIGIGTAATAIAALEHGKVDAGMMGDPAYTILSRRTPGARVLADLRTGDGVREAFGADMYPASVLYSTTAWIQGNRDTTSRLARAIVKTLAWMQTHTPAEIAEKTPPTFRGGDTALYVDALKNSMSMFSPDGRMEGGGAEAVRKLLADSMDTVAHASIDLTKTYTNEFIDARR